MNLITAFLALSMPGKTYLVVLIIVTLAATAFILYLTLRNLKTPFPKLGKYIKNASNDGVGKGEMRKSLIDSGWPGNVVDDELKKYQ